VTEQVRTLDVALHDTLSALLALLDALPADSPFLQLDAPQRRQRTLAALKWVLLRQSQRQPVLLVCEDLHWLDTETQALLDSLGESRPTARLLLLVNYRPDYRHGWGSKTYYTQVRLDPLPPASADTFLQDLVGNDPSLSPLTQLLIQRTEGNPFFLEESVRTLVETGALVGEAGAYRVAPPLPTIQVPATVQAVLAARIDRVPPEEKHLLQTAAVLGTEVLLPLLQAVAELPEAALRLGLAHLQDAEFLYEASLFPELVYTFKHALTQEVAYGSLLQERRRVLHARIVAALRRPLGTVWPSRSNASPTMPYGGRCGTKPWRTAGKRETKPWRAVPTRRRRHTMSRRSAPSHVCRRRGTPTSRPSISGSLCARRSTLWASSGGSSSACRKPKPAPRRWAITTD
jgi:predicted ATPase